MLFWEENIYSKSKQINKMPYDDIIRFIYSNFGNLSKKEKKEIKVLDLGCGSGNHCWFLSREGFNTFGIDISKSAINITEKYLSTEKLSANLTVGEFKKLPYVDNYFDIIIDRLAITHDPENIDTVLKEVSRVIKPDGKFITIMFGTEHSDYINNINIIDKENKIYGITKMGTGYLSKSGGATYFLDDNSTILKKYFKINNQYKRTTEYSKDNIHVEIISILQKCIC